MVPPLQASLLASLCLVVVEGTSPGLVGRITDKGLDYARLEAIAALQQRLTQLSLPEFSGSFKVSVLGNVDYDFYSMNIQSFQLPSSGLVPVPGMGLKVSINNAVAELTGQWKVQKRRWLKDHGSFDLRIEGISISLGLKLGSDTAGRLTASTSDCSAHISDVHVHISSRLSWLYNLFRGRIEGALRRTMEGKICGEVTSSVQTKLQPFLQTMPVTAKVDKVAGIDYSLVGPPQVTTNAVDLNLKGEWFSLSHRSPSPLPTPALNFSMDHDRMLYLGISNYFFNTAGDVYYKAGALNFQVTDDMIPKEFQIRLNTSSFGAFVPEVQKLYPNLAMKLELAPPSAPSLSITPDGLSLTPVVDIQAFAILPNSTLAPLFVLTAKTTLSANAAISSTKISGALKLGRLQLSLKHSDVGPFSPQLIQALMNYYLASVLVPQINARLAEGFPLPLPDHLQLSNTVLQMRQDFLLVGADVGWVW